MRWITYKILKDYGLNPEEDGLARFLPQDGRLAPLDFLRLPIEPYLAEAAGGYGEKTRLKILLSGGFLSEEILGKITLYIARQAAQVWLGHYPDFKAPERILESYLGLRAEHNADSDESLEESEAGAAYFHNAYETLNLERNRARKHNNRQAIAGLNAIIRCLSALESRLKMESDVRLALDWLIQCEPARAEQNLTAIRDLVERLLDMRRTGAN